MSIWQQHFYTWSTKSLSGNKVGLGVVAASEPNRDYLRIAGTAGAKSEPFREEKNLILERMYYSEELSGFIRTGSVPSRQGADQRNNRFVHIYSSKWKDNSYPEDYLCPLSYETEWKGEEKLQPIIKEEKKNGRKTALYLAERYGLKDRLPELCYVIYHAMLASEKPLVIVNASLKKEKFAEFAREMMILIHYLLPKALRKDADYLSYAAEMNQEAHFLFADQPLGKYHLNMNKIHGKRNFTLLEEEFFKQMASAFLEENQEFERRMDRIDQVILGLVDRRNQLEKCILTVMAPYAGKQKQKEDYFSSMERLMYWARKDVNLLKPLEDSIRELDYRTMEEDDLFSYTKLMLTGAGGETVNLTFEQLNQMLQYYYKKNQDIFYGLLNYIRENHGSFYERLLITNHTDSGFTKDVIFESIETISDLEYAVKYHKTFCSIKEYEDYLLNSAYVLYCHATSLQKQDTIDALAKIINEDCFIEKKRKDVEAVIRQAEDLNDYLHILSKMDLHRLEKQIHRFLYERSLVLLKKEQMILPSLERKLFDFAKDIEMAESMEAELLKYYEEKLRPCIFSYRTDKLISVYPDVKFFFKNNISFHDKKSTKIFCLVKNKLFANRYLELAKKDANVLCHVDTEQLIEFVLKVTDGLSESEKKLGKEMIHRTKQMVVQSQRLELLAKVNRTLRKHSTAQIHCPESMWKEEVLSSEEDFTALYEQVEDISLVRCEKSGIYHKVKDLYRKADEYEGTRKEKASYAWKKLKNRNRGGDGMYENPFIKALHYAVEDILSKSIWAVLLGFYGFLFVTVREEVRILYSYNPSVFFLIILVILYVIKTVIWSEKKETPGAVLYVMGISVLFMNWGLALDTVKSIYILFITAFLLAIAGKVIHYIFFIKQRDESQDED